MRNTQILCLPQMQGTCFSKLNYVCAIMISVHFSIVITFTFSYLLHISPSVILPISFRENKNIFENTHTLRGFRKKISFFVLVIWHNLLGEGRKKLKLILFFFQPQRGMLQAHDTSSLPTVTMRNKSKTISFPLLWGWSVSAALYCPDN